MEQDEFTRRRSCLSSQADDSHPAYLLLNVRQQSDMPGSLDGLSQRPLMLGAIATPAPWLDLAPIRDEAPQQGRIPVTYVIHLVSTESAYSPLRNVLRPGCSSHWSSCCIHHSSSPFTKTGGPLPRSPRQSCLPLPAGPPLAADQGKGRAPLLSPLEYVSGRPCRPKPVFVACPLRRLACL